MPSSSGSPKGSKDNAAAIAALRPDIGRVLLGSG